MLGSQCPSRIDTSQLKQKIEMRIGHSTADKYFRLLSRFLCLKISKAKFQKVCLGTLGKENLHLHNCLIRSIISNACLSKIPQSRESKLEGSLGVKVTNGHQSSFQSVCKDFPPSPKRGRTPNLQVRKIRESSNLLGSHAKNHSISCKDSTPRSHELLGVIELHSFGSRPPGSVEDGEEVDQDSGSVDAYCRSPVKAPLGVSMNSKGKRKVLYCRIASAVLTETCHKSGELPDTSSLQRRLEQKLNMEGFDVSVDCANLLNNALNVYLKGLIKPCLELASSKSVYKHFEPRNSCIEFGINGMKMRRFVQQPSGPASASISDFWTSVQLTPNILGEDWPMLLEKVPLHALQD